MARDSNHPAKFDYAAIGMSVLCVLHCLALPLLATAMPWIVAIGLVDEWFHLGMLAFVVPVSLYALGRAWWLHGHRLTLAVGLLGLMLMVIAPLEFLAGHSEAREQLLTLLGAAVLSGAHLSNLRNLFRIRESCDPNPVAVSIEVRH